MTNVLAGKTLGELNATLSNLQEVYRNTVSRIAAGELLESFPEPVIRKGIRTTITVGERYLNNLQGAMDDIQHELDRRG
jgi:hypothetical protein